ncbi:STAS domain-containing protein [Kitasatospora sp. NPDC096147]|uniref:STAS domain-containing protein n=1 Tax=Kitasatospora sp. NPDC096147 TaxID=3364093 RepID=UPI00382F8211
MPVHDDEGLTVDLRPSGEHAVVCTLAGDLDIESLAPAEQVLGEALRSGPATLVIDLEQVGFCDSSGLNLLLKVRVDAKAADVGLRLAAPSAPVRRLLELTGAEAVFELHPSVRAALGEPG